jgi:CDP-diacylglycerol--glycerol-3-phosphate 3-phosphatidyltransferase
VNLPNTLTLGRIFLVPLLVVVLLTKFDGREWFGISNEVLGAAIFAVASLTDWLDGFLARRRGQVTGLGQWMDPLADKLLVTAALISLVQMGLAPAWMVAIILGREFAVTVLRSIVHARGQSLPASPIGKIKMVAQVVAILLLILGPRHMQEFFVLGQAALWVATIAALVSAVDYSRRANAVFAARPVPPPAARPAPGLTASSAPLAGPGAPAPAPAPERHPVSNRLRA